MITQFLPGGSFDQGYNPARSLPVDSQPGVLLQRPEKAAHQGHGIVSHVRFGSTPVIFAGELSAL